MITWNPPIGIGPIRFYALFWMIGLAGAYFLVQRLYKEQKIKDALFEPLFFYCFIGILAGARLGHCIFYEPQYYFADFPRFLEMLLPIRFTHTGVRLIGYQGLASHGGTLGLMIALWLYVRKYKVGLWNVLDDIAIATPVTACCIRLGNLMNSEIYGTPTDLPWGFIFVRDGQTVPCHPTQIYEMLYCIVAFVVTWLMYWKGKAYKREGLLLGVFLEIIFFTRFMLEFIKNDQELFEAGHLLNMGQVLSLPFVIWGIYLIIRAYKRPALP